VKRVLLRILGAGVVAFAVIQFVRPGIPQPAVAVAATAAAAAAEIDAPPEVRAVLRKDCYNCHSDEHRLAWFDELQPAYWLVRKDILDARARLNFSTIGAKPEAAQKGALYEAVAMMMLGAMPLPRYTLLHSESKVSAEDLETLKKYLSPWSSPIPQAAAGGASSAEEQPLPVAAKVDQARPAPNGLPYDGSWIHWKLLAVTDRGDNRQYRMILGNDIAVTAAREGKVSPWPEGARFAKAAWFEEQTPDGLIFPKKFWQVELMVKGAEQYQATEGWGWGRWRGLELMPYGKDATFVNECTGCHQPLRGNDYVYTIPFSASGATVSREREVLNNRAVAYPKGTPFDPLRWTPITVYTDSRKATISVLFAREAEKVGGGSSSAASANAGDRADLALVTWTERDDPHWFGARMPDKVISVEAVHVNQGHAEYQSFSAAGSAAGDASAAAAAERSRFISRLRAVQVPELAR